MNNQPIYDDGQGHLYQLTSVASDYDTAAAEAAANGGQLVSINNATENTYLTNAFGASGNPYLWIGYSDAATEGTWLWNDANINTYTNWGGTEPNGSTAENYAALGTTSVPNAIGTWYDSPGSSSFYGIIEYAVTVEQRIPWQTVEELDEFRFAVTNLHITDPFGTNPDGSPVDGITYAVATTLTSNITLQEPSNLLSGTVLAADTVIPDGTTFPYDVSLGSDLILPFAISFPDGTTYAAGDTIPSGSTIPGGSTILGGYTVPTGGTLTIPAAVELTFPAGTVVLAGTVVPAGTYLDNILDNDSNTPIFNDAFTGLAAGGDGSLTYTATLDDVNPDTGEYLPLPCWLSIDPVTGLFTGTTPYDHFNPDANTYNIRVVASDTVHGYSAEDSFQLLVAPHENVAPSVDSGFSNQTFNEKANSSVTFSQPFTDPDRLAVLTYSAEAYDSTGTTQIAWPSWLTFDAVTSDNPNTFTDDKLTFSGKAPNSAVGSITIKVTANDGIYADRGTIDNLQSSDGTYSVASSSFVLTINNVNDRPYVAHPIPDNVSNDYPHGGVTIYQNDAYTYTVPTVPLHQGVAQQVATTTSVFGDIDLPYGFNQGGTHQDETLSYSARLVSGKALPSWLHFDPATQTFSNESTPGNYVSNAGTYDIRVTATDAHGANTYDSFRLAVTDVNDVPTGSSTATPANGVEDQHDATGIGATPYVITNTPSTTGTAAYTISEASLLQGFSDADGANDRLGVVNATINSHASVSYSNTTGVIGKGTFTITPDADYNGTVTLDYAVQDYTKASTMNNQVLKTDRWGGADTPAPGSVDITFTTVNDAPVFVDAYSLDWLSEVWLGATSVATPWLSEDDGNNGQVATSISSDAWSWDGEFLPLVFTDVDSYDTHIATASLISSDYHIADGSIDGSSTVGSLGTLNVNIDSPWWDSTALDPGAIDPNDWEGQVDWSYDLDGSNPEVDALADGEYQVEKFNVTVTDDGMTNGNSDPLSTVVNKEIDVTIWGTNDAPALTGTAATLLHATEDTSYTIHTSDLLQGFTDVDHGDKVSTDTIVNLQATTGSASYVDISGPDADGAFTVTPVDNYNGVINLTYQVDDGHGSNNLSTVTNQSFTIDPVEDAPAVNSSLTTQNAQADVPFVYDVQAAVPISFKDPDIFSDGATHYVDTATAYTSSVITTSTDFSTTEDHLTFSVTSNVLKPGSLTEYEPVSKYDSSSWVSINSQTGVVSGTPTVTSEIAAVPNQGLVAIRVVATDVMGLSVATYFNVSLGLNGTSSNDTITGVAGNDVISGLGGNDSLSGLAGNDNIYGGDGADTLIGGADDDSLDGGTGNDVFNGDQTGNDTIVGGSGNDTLDYSTSTDPVAVDFTTGVAGSSTTAPVGASGIDSISGIENVNGSQGDNFLKGDVNNNIFNGYAGNDTLNGGNGNDTLNGGDGNDTLNGGGNDDKLDGGAGNDTFNGTQAGNDIIIGGTGTDTLDYSTSNDVINVNLTAGTSTSTTAGVIPTPTVLSGTDTISGIENVTGSSANNTLTGDANNNVLSGNGGNDTLTGFSGDDSLSGGNGDDTFTVGVVVGTTGSNGNDTYDGGAGSDSINFTSTAETVAIHVDLTNSGLQLVSSTQGTDKFVGIENITATSFNDTVIGNDGANHTFFGQLGNDSLVGGNGTDSLNGGKGIDTILAGAGNDTLAGAFDNDTLTGDVGSDHFVFSVALGATGTAGTVAGVDTITDFTSGSDVIDLSKAIFTHYTSTATGLSADGTFLIYNAGTGVLSYDANGATNGATDAVQIALLGTTTHPTLGADFAIIA